MAALPFHLRALAALAAAAAVAAALYAFQALDNPLRGWWLVALALVLGAVGQLGVDYPAPPPAPPPRPASRRRVRCGLLLAAAGAVLWAYAVRTLLRDWVAGFDAAWLAWLAATALLAVGLDLAWGVWPEAVPARRWWQGWPPRLALVLVAVAAVLRLGNIADFPGEAAITQIEDLQVGNFGHAYLGGYRVRWEYLSSTWLAALGLTLGGPTEMAVRIPFAVVSAIKLLPIFVWLRLTVGTTGALVGCALLAVSFWDVMLSRIPNNHNVLAIAVAFALLAGPARRGRPSAYVLLGFLGGYILHEYIAYRPLVVWALAGGLCWSLADRAATWPRRLLRPALTAVLIGSMVTPLFVTRLPGEFRSEYVDGVERARGITSYYNAEDTWGQALERRVARARNAAELFLDRGDRSPVRNMKLWPLIDPVSAALLVLGIAGALVHPARPVLLLTLAGFAVHVLGTLVLTGNFDVARVGGSAGFAYVLAGAGAAGVAAALAAAWGRSGRWLATTLLAVAVAWAASWNVDHLRQFWSAPEIRRAHRNNLAYLTIWLRTQARPGERVIGIAPQYTNVLEGHDGSWLRGGRLDGDVTSDVPSALRAWLAHPQASLFFIFTERTSDDVAAYLEWLVPGLRFQVERDPLALGGDVAFAHVEAPPADLTQRLAAAACRGAQADFTVIGQNLTDIVAGERVVVPFIDRSVWPQSLMDVIQRLAPPPSRLRLRFSAAVSIAAAGEYRFALDSYAGQATLRIDGRRVDTHGFTAVELTSGRHEILVEGEFALVTPALLLRWMGPDSDGRPALVPFYRIAEPIPDCPAAAPEAPHAP